jgi:hypothetical protein
MLAGHIPSLVRAPAALLPLTTAYMFLAAHQRMATLFVAFKWALICRVSGWAMSEEAGGAAGLCVWMPPGDDTLRV